MSKPKSTKIESREWRQAMKLSRENVLRLQGLTIALLLTACAGVTAIGAGCDAYRLARSERPSDAALIASHNDVVSWINSLDVRMGKACLK